MAKKVLKKTKKSGAKKPKKKVMAAAAPVGKLVEIDVKLPLTDAEARIRSKMAWEKRQEKDKLVLERKDIANRYKARIDSLSAEESTLLEESSEGLEVRTVKAREIKNHGRQMMEYHYKGDIVFQRPMTLAEKQQDELPMDPPASAPLPKVSAVAAKSDEVDVRPTELKHTMEAPKKKPVLRPLPTPSNDPVAAAHAVDEQAQREDVASVIRSETSARDKWSATDGIRN